MADIKTIGICTGGGDCPGLNAVIRGATRSAILQHGWRVIGIRDGFDGLIWPERTFELNLQAVSGILPRGGTILGTTNRGNPFEYKISEFGQEIVRDVSDQVVTNARRMGMDAVIVVGGDGTQGIGLKLWKKGLPVVGVPKTIDNDLEATDFTFGFDTAIHTVTEAIDKLFSTAESHHRIMVVEVMGREAGWIALHGGIAGGAHVILVPEIPFTNDLKTRFEEEKRTYPRAGAVGNLIGDGLGICTKKDVRVTVLGHVQRGGTPSPFDRVLSTRFGAGAVELIAQRKFGYMVALRGDSVTSVSIEEACGKNKLVDPKSELVRVAKATGICFGDETMTSPGD